MKTRIVIALVGQMAAALAIGFAVTILDHHPDAPSWGVVVAAAAVAYTLLTWANDKEFWSRW